MSPPYTSVLEHYPMDLFYAIGWARIWIAGPGSHHPKSRRILVLRLSPEVPPDNPVPPRFIGGLIL